MFLENSPFSGPLPALRSSDLIVYGHIFKRIVLIKIPTCKEVLFVTEKDIAAFEPNLSGGKIRQIRNKVFTRKKAVCLEPDKIILPLDITDRDDLAVLITGIDRLMVQSTVTQWLHDTGIEIVQDFLEERNLVLDPLTSLYNVSGYNQFMADKQCDDMFHVVLVESLPPAKSIKDVVGNLAETARILEEFNRLSFPLFHLGHSIFCYVISRRNSKFVKSLCRSLTTFARNGGLRKTHIGFSGYNPQRHKKTALDNLAEVLLDEAWQALQKAGRRGPYAFCDYELLVNPDMFPLKPVSKSGAGKIAYRVKGYDSFSLVFLKPDFKQRTQFDRFMQDCIGNEIIVSEADGYLVVRPGKSEKKTKQWAESLIKRIISQAGERYSMSAGISSYPFRDYKKSEIIKNCQKALLHGSFFGPGSTVIFDSLSLNVSGDAYFGESDLSSAVKEYRRGLEISPQDVNLLNSLGVAHALMNRTAKAQQIFNQVLEIEPKNFMALFNKGLGEKKIGQYASAVHSFYLALKSYNKKDADETAVINDLRYHFGTCLYRVGDYSKSISVLEDYHKSTKSQPGHERCFKYIGMSYYILKNYKQAAKWLQRGLSANQADAESLSLLGMIYLKTGEGDDIALKLCEKSVEIDPDSPDCKLRYGQTLAACGELEKARDIYMNCARSKKVRAAVWVEMARLHLLQNEVGSAEHCLKKVFNRNDVDPAILHEAETIKNNLNEQ